MLSREDAQEALKTVHVSNWQQLLRQSLDEHPHRDIGYFLIGLDATGKSWSYNNINQEWYDEQRSALHQLSADERHDLFCTLLPSTGHYLNPLWELLAGYPYQTGYSRRAFRTQNEEYLRDSRQDRIGGLIQLLAMYRNQDVQWFAAWAAHVPDYRGLLGFLLAAVIEASTKDSDIVFDILLATGRGEHEIGVMDRHVIRALLMASRPGGWTFIENMLIAAQRQEGLRQSILETVDEAHPIAFARMVRLIVEENLIRFAATIRAIDVWFGFGWDAIATTQVRNTLQTLYDWFDRVEEIPEILQQQDAETQFLMLWRVAYDEVLDAISLAQSLLTSKKRETRFAATYFLKQLRIAPAHEALMKMLDDVDLSIAMLALEGLVYHGAPDFSESTLFEASERLIERFPKKGTMLDPVVWEWLPVFVDRQFVADNMLYQLGNRPVNRMRPYVSLMSADGRGRMARQLAKMKPQTAEIRDLMFEFLADRSDWVRGIAYKALESVEPDDNEATYLENLLTRKSADTRRNALHLIFRRHDDDVLASAERLLNSRKSQQRLGGMELLRQLIDADRAADKALQLGHTFADTKKKLTTAEEELLKAVLKPEPEAVSIENVFGLINPDDRTPVVRPQPREFTGFTPAAERVLESLDQLIEDHRETELELTYYDGRKVTVLLGDQRGIGPRKAFTDFDEYRANVPLRELWETWYTEREDDLRDRDGLEIIRALAHITTYHMPGGWLPYNYVDIRTNPVEMAAWLEALLSDIHGTDSGMTLRYPELLQSVLRILIRLFPVETAANFLLDATESMLAAVPDDIVERNYDDQDQQRTQWRQNRGITGWKQLTHQYAYSDAVGWQDHHTVRLWQLARWYDQPTLTVPRVFPSIELVLKAYQLDTATEADVYENLLSNFQVLRQVTGKQLPKPYSDYDFLPSFVETLRKRIIDVEVQRGDMATPATRPALAIRHNIGLSSLLTCLRALGKDRLHRGYGYDSSSKIQVLSHLIRVTFPEDHLEQDVFNEAVAAAGLSEERLIEVAVYAPQWAVLVEGLLGWEKFTEAVWWIHAHTKDTQWHVDNDIRTAWAAEMAEYTPLRSEDLMEGAVDVGWFRRLYNILGDERWNRVYDASKLASSSGGHKRAQLFADAMLGSTTATGLIKRIQSKRHQDSVRALGLVPISSEDDVLERYQEIQEFVRGSNKFGSQRKASEKRAADIGMQNLARTAGYPDPVRLEWAMEAREIADLADGPVVVEVDNLKLTLAINSLGEPKLTIEKDGKRQKSIPKKLKKHADIVAIQERNRKIGKQISRMRSSLEAAMIRGEHFSGKEIRDLLQHPVLRPMLLSVVLVNDEHIGYPSEDGGSCVSHDNTYQPLADNDMVRIAHPYDLLQTNEWHLWQRECFLNERIQPFKQIYRELYVLTSTEQTEHSFSRRYAGHQVQPRQALALLGSRGWVARYEEGMRRTFHEAGISSWIHFLEGFYTPAEIEGLTIEAVGFSRQGDWKPLPLEDVPPRIFSEVMRDVDLVVSVAHMGGVDPEASASTVEMRRSLADETLHLLGKDNVTLKDNHALIEGQLGNYSVHLGSAIVHRQPGGAVCIIPVHSQQRGRLFLPFADDDPKTAEVLSKILLLADDHKIKDPSILQQIV